MSDSNDLIVSGSDQLLRETTRRRFLGLLGAAGAIVLLPSVFASCDDDNNVTDPLDPATYRLELDTDTGILNYAYALEQLEAAFYTAAITSAGYAALTANEQEVIADLQKHELLHRELLKMTLGGGAIPAITFNATTMATKVSTRGALLTTSQLLEDTGVAAYNGAGKYLADAKNLLLVAKIASVEARHAAAIRDMRDTTGRRFAGDDVVNGNGLDVKSEPATVLANVGALQLLVSPVSIGASPARAAATPNFDPPTPT